MLLENDTITDHKDLNLISIMPMSDLKPREPQPPEIDNSVFLPINFLFACVSHLGHSTLTSYPFLRVIDTNKDAVTLVKQHQIPRPFCCVHLKFEKLRK